MNDLVKEIESLIQVKNMKYRIQKTKEEQYEKYIADLKNRT